METGLIAFRSTFTYIVPLDSHAWPKQGRDYNAHLIAEEKGNKEGGYRMSFSRARIILFFELSDVCFSFFPPNKAVLFFMIIFPFTVNACRNVANTGYPSWLSHSCMEQSSRVKRVWWQCVTSCLISVGSLPSSKCTFQKCCLLEVVGVLRKVPQNAVLSLCTWNLSVSY